MDLHLTDETSPISKKRKQDQLSTSEFNVGNKLLRIQYGRQSVQGMRSEMEDADKALVDVTKDKIESDNNRFSFFGVYDGHGGKKASEYLATRFHNILREEKNKGLDMKEALANSFAKVELEYLQKAENEDLNDGTTASVLVIDHTRMIAGSVGDSEIVLSRSGKAIPLCEIHNPSKNKDEISRIINDGGRVYKNRVLHPIAPIFSIAVSRAIGDRPFKNPEMTLHKKTGLIATPDIREYEITSEDEFAILACDGLWDVISHQDAVDFVHVNIKNTKDPQKTTENLVQEALRRGSSDNITALVVIIKFNEKIPDKSELNYK